MAVLVGTFFAKLTGGNAGVFIVVLLMLGFVARPQLALFADAISPNFSHVYNGDEVLDLFFKPTVATEEVFNRYRVMPNVVGKSNIYLRGIAEKILKKITTCSFNAKGQLEITDKTIEVHPVAVHLEQCERAFDGTVFEKAWLNQGTDRTDLTGTVVQELVEQFIADGLERDVPRGLWWNKVGAADADYDYGFNGWLQLFLADTAAIGFVLDISTFETANKLDVDAAAAIFQELIEGQTAASRKFGKDLLRLYVSSSILDNYKRTLRASGTDFGATIQVNGIDRPAFDGYQIIEIPSWDVDMDDAGNPTVGDLNTTSNSLVILTTPENLIIGIDSQNAAGGNDAVIWYSLDNQSLRAVINFQYGAQILHESLFSVAL